MTTHYTGDPANVTTPLVRAISAIANTTPVQVTTSAPHLFSTADIVVLVATGIIDGGWTITVTGANTFTLNGSSASGTSSTGTAIDTSLTPNFQCPSNAELATVDSILAAVKTLADRSQFLNKTANDLLTRLNGVRVLVDAQQGQPNVSGWGVTHSSTTFAANCLTPSAHVAAGDVVECTIQGTAYVFSASSATAIEGNIFASVVENGGAPINAGRPQDMGESFTTGAGGDAFYVPFALTFQRVVATAGTFAVKLNLALTTSSVGDAMALDTSALGSASLNVTYQVFRFFS
jgi:hypothetical protein